jgi:tetratricopeptide (TPR) repeat protein
MRDEVYNYGSFLQSRMNAHGVTCSDCHDPHTQKLRATGNAVCAQCHHPERYDNPRHTRHAEGTPGSACAACHMPTTTYMVVDPRHDHSFRIPRPDRTASLGTPNACTQCHDDRDAPWAAARVAAWYGPGRRQEVHYGEAFAAARAGRPDAGPRLARLAADRAQPPIVRATALDALRGDAASGMDVRIDATREADAALRAAAVASFDSTPPDQRRYALVPLLTDPVRAVRIAAAAALSALPRAEIPAEQQAAFDRALSEYLAAQQLSADMPGARLNLAVVYANTGQDTLAEQHYLAALRIDPDFTPARANLSRLYAAAGRNADAERVLAEGLAREPGIGELQYSLGLLLAEEGRLPEAAKALSRAAAALPQRARVHYNLGLALQRIGQRAAAETALLRAQSLAPDDPDAVFALAVLYAQDARWTPALRWGERLLELSPGDPNAARLVEQLRAKR